jgi:hypothetical protein
VGTSLAVVANKLEAADHLTNGEEPEALGSDDTTGSELGRANVAGALKKALCGLATDGAGSQ